MLKFFLTILINIVTLSAIWILMKSVQYKKTDNTTVFFGLLFLISIVYLIEILVFRIIFVGSSSKKCTKGLFTGVIMSIFVFVLTNTLVMVRPIINLDYILNLLFAFTTGFILPYTEKIIKKIIDPHK